MESPLVSIIIPAWNAEKYVKEAVDSALNQTHENIEVIVVDDGSTDSTKNILDSFIKNKRIKYFYQTNKGLAGARDTGILSAKGDYIAFLDSDDVFLPQKITKQIQSLEDNSDFGVSYCDLLHFTDEEPRRFFHHRYHYPSGQLFEALLKKQFINPLSVVIRRSVLDKFGLFDEKLRRSEDWELWLRLARAGVKFLYLNEILAHYRIRSIGNLSSIESEPEMKEKNLEIFTKIKNQLTPNEVGKYKFEKILKKLRNKLALSYLMVGAKKRALQSSPSAFLVLIIKITPLKMLKSTLGIIREIKHRSLLKKYKSSLLNPS